MTATYAATIPTAKDAVRLELGDTDVGNALLQDEEITYFLGLEGEVVLLAAARGAGALAGRFARLVSRSTGDTSVEAQQVYEHYTALAAALTRRAVTSSGAAVPYAAGLTESDVATREGDPDRVRPFFTRRTGDNPPWPPADDRRWP